MTQFALNFPDALPEVMARPHAGSPLQERSKRLALASGDAPFDRVGFDIGWDYARHRLAPSPDHLHAGHPVRQGWQAGRATFGTRTQRPTHAVAQWLQLRLEAWMHGRAFEEVRVTPRFLSQLEVTHCPVTRDLLTHEVLTQGSQAETDGVIVTLNEGAGVAAGNLAMMSRRAALADLEGDGLDLNARQRLVSLRRMTTPLSHAEAAAHPLSVLPPARVHLLNPAHALQVLLTRLFMGGAYARRMADLGVLVPARARRPYAQLMSTLLARRLAVGWSAHADRVRHTLEDAWQHPLVLQRWASFIQGLSLACCERLVQRAVERGLAGPQVRWLNGAEATDGWALETSGRCEHIDAAPVAPSHQVQS